MADNTNQNPVPISLDGQLNHQLDSQTTNTASTGNESTWSKLSREAYVLGDGLATGFSKGAQESLHDPTGTGLRLATAIGTGAALTLLSRGGTLPALIAEGVGAGMTLSFAADVVRPERLQALGQVAKDTWQSDNNTDANVGIVSDQLGRFAFDSTLMSVGAVGGALAKCAPFFENKSLFRSSSSTAQPYEIYRTGGAYGATDGTGSNKFEGLFQDRQLPSLSAFPSGELRTPINARILTANTLSLPMAEIRSADQLNWLRPQGKELSWKPTEGSIATRIEAQSFVRNFMAQDYHAALSDSINAKVMEHVELNQNARATTVEVEARKLSDPESLQLHMSQIAKIGVFKWDQIRSGADVLNSSLRVNIPRTVVELQNGGAKVALVDFVKSENGYRNSYSIDYPTRTVTGEALTPEQQAEIEAIRKSPEGQRILAETAIIAFEESIAHANQHITQHGDIISPTYARFSRDFSIEKGTRSQFLNFLGMVGKDHPMRVHFNEQEVPTILYDAGMPLPVIEHHYFFGGRHVEERLAVMSYLRDVEATKGYEYNGPQPEEPERD